MTFVSLFLANQREGKRRKGREGDHSFQISLKTKERRGGGEGGGKRVKDRLLFLIRRRGEKHILYSRGKKVKLSVPTRFPLGKGEGKKRGCWHAAGLSS